MAKKISQLKDSEAIDGSELLEVSQTVGGSLSSRKASIQKIGAYIGSDLSTVATTGQYADLKGKPSLFSGAYGDLTGKPAVIAAGDTEAEARAAIGAGTSSLTLGTTASTAMAGNTPIPAAVTSNGDLTNDAGYLTEHQSLAAYAKTADVATKAQGSKADSAVQPDDLADVATTGA